MEITKQMPQFPECLQQFPVRVFVGGCFYRGEGSKFPHKAHAHLDPDKNWICFLSAKRLQSRELCLHEVAHILTHSGHTDEWRAKVIEIGGTLDEVPGILRSYHKRSRIK